MMVTLEDISSIKDIQGVEQYVLVDDSGLIKVCHMDNPEKMVKVIQACAENSFSIAGNRFKYIKLSRKNNKDLYVFPIGSYYLGVEKHTTANDEIFKDNMIGFLSSLLKKHQCRKKKEGNE